MSGRGLVDVEIDDRTVVIRPRGALKLWSLRRRLELPREAITAARVTENPSDEVPVRLRVGGLATLATRAGFMRGPTGRSWWCYSFGRSAVVLDVALPKLSRVVFIADDNSAVAASLAPTVASRSR